MALKQVLHSVQKTAQQAERIFISKGHEADLLSLKGTTLAKGRTWDEGIASSFSRSSMDDVFKGKRVVIFGIPGAFTGVCTRAHVPSYLKNVDRFKQKGVDTIICTAVNDPYVMRAWAHDLNALDKIDFYGDYSADFHKELGLDVDLTNSLMGVRSERWAAYVEDGKIRILQVEKVTSEFHVSGGEHMLQAMEKENLGESK
eukprot:jgi/Mesen1/7185/ME000037S06544